MAHELDDRTAEDGKAMFYVGGTPWHKHGRSLEHAPSVAQGLKAGGLDWRVERRPVWTLAEPVGPEVERPEDAEEGRVDRVPDAFTVCRCDRNGTDGVLGVVGGRYRVLQNREAFSVWQPLIDGGLLELETGGALRGGRQVWMLGRLQPEKMIEQAARDAAGESGADPDEVAAKMQAIFEESTDRIEPYGLITNSHDGSGAVQVRETVIRVVCKNTLEMSLNGKGRTISVRHTGAVDEKVQDAAEELWGQLVARYRRLAELVPVMRDVHVPEPVFRRLVLDEVAPLKPEEELETERAKTEQEKRIEKREEIQRLWISGAGHVGDESAWEAMNGVVQAIDHSEQWMRGRSGNRVRQMLDGGLYRTKRRVSDRLVRYARDESFRSRVHEEVGAGV